MSDHVRPLGLGFVGCGGVTQRGHLPALRTMPEVEVVAVADIDPERLHLVAGEFGISRRYPDAARLLADPAVEAVAVCVPARHHTEVALAALAAGKHIFLEKPIALSLPEADHVIAAVTASRLTAQMGFNLRWHRLVREARACLTEGALGRVVAIRSVLTSGTRFHHDAPPWRKRRDAGGGEFLETAIHHFDLWRYLLDTDIAELSAASRSGQWDDETVAITARLANDALASAMFSVATAGSHQLEIYGETGRLALSLLRFDGLELVGMEAYPGGVRDRLGGLVRVLGALPGAVLRARRGGDFIDSYRLGWKQFVESARGRAPAACTLEDGRHALRAALAAIASAARGRSVQVDRVGDLGLLGEPSA